MSIKDQFTELRTTGGFGCIYADPPWMYENYSEKGERKNPNQHYDCVTADDLEDMPVRLLAANDCWLFMWATFPCLPQALKLMDEWGFTYSTGLAWAKQSKRSGDKDMDDPDHKLAFGTGYIFRSAAELLLMGRRGKPKLFKREGSRSIRNLIVAPVREHSRKPDSVYDMIELRVPGPYVELFSRSSRAGWAAWGNETGKYDADDRD
jgi:N6-adenosine-specific RNA methylase IME4